MLKFSISFICLSVLLVSASAQSDKILLFVSDEDTYYSEYIVMYEALLASGYQVEVRNAGTASATMYTIGGDIIAQANGLAGSSYADFQIQYATMFGANWNELLNPVPASIAISDSIQAVGSISSYEALVVAGGTGAVDFRVDGSYTAQGSLSAQQVQSAAEKLNELAVEALQLGIPVMGQCHGASVPAYWRVPGTEGNGFDNLGHSILSNSVATGYPEPETAGNMSDLNITFRANDKVVVGTPHSSLNDEHFGQFRIITTRDWYPQTVAHAAKTLTNMIESYPDATLHMDSVSVLIIHGGEVDLNNCGAGNQNNDIPCNYGVNPPSNIPADYTDLVSLFNSNQFSDGFEFDVSDVNLFASTPFNLNNQSEIFGYLMNFDVVFFYKHWSNNVTNELQQAIVDYADAGKGVVSIHHGLYNESKNILVDSLFEAHSPAMGWSANRTTYRTYMANYGHFVSTYNIITDTSTSSPAAWNMNPLLTGSNLSGSLYHRFELFDEIYNNMQFTASAEFGDNINQITPIFSNDQSPGDQSHVHGFVKLFDADADGMIGRVVYGSPGETMVNYQYPHPYAQFLRNAVFWARGSAVCSNHSSTWVANSGDWDVGTNWSSAIVPGPCTHVLIPDQVSETTINVPAATEINIHLLEVGLNVVFDVPLGTIFTVLGN